jgi:hypothetical protein
MLQFQQPPLNTVSSGFRYRKITSDMVSLIYGRIDRLGGKTHIGNLRAARACLPDRALSAA